GVEAAICLPEESDDIEEMTELIAENNIRRENDLMNYQKALSDMFDSPESNKEDKNITISNEIYDLIKPDIENVLKSMDDSKNVMSNYKYDNDLFAFLLQINKFIAVR
ncbi:MAG: hypothetical protein J5603_05125, partial [Bacteroidales bacterium]|nr:hypothetical protein [Bacteroidales bacterium]